MINRNKKGIICGTIAAISYGTNPLFALYLYLGKIGVNSVLFYRYAIAVLIYGFWLKIINKQSLKIPKKTIFPLIILGILFSASSLTLFESFNYIDAGIACTILFIYPIIVTFIMHTFFKEKINKTTILSLILTTTGIFLLYKSPNNASIRFSNYSNNYFNRNNNTVNKTDWCNKNRSFGLFRTHNCIIFWSYII